MCPFLPVLGALPKGCQVQELSMYTPFPDTGEGDGPPGSYEGASV